MKNSEVIGGIHWECSATGEKYPSGLSSSHPLWKTFLDSSSNSPTAFFRAFVSPPSYFQSPTPWTNSGSNGLNRRSRLAQKVSELLDSFRPGSYSYNPFKKEVVKLSMRDGDEREAPRIPLEPVSPVNTNAPREDIRQRLYVDMGRPRPFYRTFSSENESRRSSEATNSVVRTLKDTVKFALVKYYGLKNLYSFLMLNTDHRLYSLPSAIKYQLLTFLCEDFEECEDVGHIGDSSEAYLTLSSVSYRVRCKHDNSIYLAVFATSEADKEGSNLWRDFGYWIQHRRNMIMPILSLVADPLTQNVFFIAKERQCLLRQYLKDHKLNNEEKKKISNSLKEAYEVLKSEKRGNNLKERECSNLLSDAFIHDDETVILKNPLLVKCNSDKSFSSFKFIFREMIAQIQDE